jgi:hypothetical protein
MIVPLIVVGALVAWFVERCVKAVEQDRKKDFYEFFSAAEAMAQGLDPYAAGGTGYIYPPLLAFLLVPLVPLGLTAATLVWMSLNLGVMGVCGSLGARETIRRMGRVPTAALLIVVTAISIAIMSDKLRNELVMGQSNLWMLLSWVLALVWLDKRPVLAGAALGFGVNIKYLQIVALPYLLIRRRWTAAAAMVVSSVGWALLPAVYVGWERNLGYLRQAFGGLLGMVKPGSGAELAEGAGLAARVPMLREGFSMSITSWSARMTSDAGVTIWTVALAGAIAMAVLGVVWLMYRWAGIPLFVGRDATADRGDLLRGVVAMEWAGLVVASLAFGPQTNSRHLAMIMLPCVVGVAIVMLPRLRVPGWPLMIGLAVMLAGLTLPPGGESRRWMVDAWQSGGGPMWCLVFMLFTLLFVGLGDARARSVEAAPR